MTTGIDTSAIDRFVDMVRNRRNALIEAFLEEHTGGKARPLHYGLFYWPGDDPTYENVTLLSDDEHRELLLGDGYIRMDRLREFPTVQIPTSVTKV